VPAGHERDNAREQQEYAPRALGERGLAHQRERAGQHPENGSHLIQRLVTKPEPRAGDQRRARDDRIDHRRSAAQLQQPRPLPGRENDDYGNQCRKSADRREQRNWQKNRQQDDCRDNTGL
jgi:hypothetical protein